MGVEYYKTMPRPFNGIAKHPTKVTLRLNSASARCMQKVWVSPRIVPKRAIGFVKPQIWAIRMHNLLLD